MLNFFRSPKIFPWKAGMEEEKNEIEKG